MTVLSLTETGPAVECALPDGQAQALARSGVVEVRPGGVPGRWRVQAGRYVGAARVGDVEVRIAPKIAIDRLLFPVGYATSGKDRRDEDLLAQIRRLAATFAG